MLLADSVFEKIGGWATVIAIFLALMGILVGYLLYRKGKKSKTLDYTPVVLTSIVRSPVSKISDGLQLTWNGVALQTPYTTVIRFVNTGNEPISRDDFRTGLMLDFDESTCFEAVVSKVSKGSLMKEGAIRVNEPDHRISIPVDDLNAGEWFEVTCIVDGSMSYPTPAAFIRGATRPTASTFEVTKPLWVGLLGLVMGVVVWAGLFTWVIIDINLHPNAGSPSIGKQIFNSAILIIGGVLLGSSVSYLSKRSVRKSIAYSDRSISM